MGLARKSPPQNPIRLQAARQAAADGRRKAQAFAEGVNAQLGALISLAEPETAAFGRRGGIFQTASSSAGADMPIEIGEQEIPATIVVAFALIP